MKQPTSLPGMLLKSQNGQQSMHSLMFKLLQKVTSMPFRMSLVQCPNPSFTFINTIQRLRYGTYSTRQCKQRLLDLTELAEFTILIQATAFKMLISKFLHAASQTLKLLHWVRSQVSQMVWMQTHSMEHTEYTQVLLPNTKLSQVNSEELLC